MPEITQNDLRCVAPSLEGVVQDRKGIRFPDGSVYDAERGELRVSSTATFQIYRRRHGLAVLLHGEWELIADIKDGNGITRGLHMFTQI